MKKQWTSLATALLFGVALTFSSCGGNNQESTPDNTSIETGDEDTNNGATGDTTTGETPSGGTGTDATGTTTTGTTSGSTTGGTTM
ncbi:hypothetical protein [Pontibacter roseus]|uniref:hypothetical protein n=1 Tax=Pontibacter roseus TaxID=336989 RepID=UPI0003662A20|nr:hypothetical protein [Pontibacter roseus]